MSPALVIACGIAGAVAIVAGAAFVFAFCMAHGAREESRPGLGTDSTTR